jgi:hypothetical protein
MTRGRRFTVPNRQRYLTCAHGQRRSLMSLQPRPCSGVRWGDGETLRFNIHSYHVWEVIERRPTKPSVVIAVVALGLLHGRTHEVRASSLRATYHRTIPLTNSSTPAMKRSRTVTYSKQKLLGMMYQLLSYCNTKAETPSAISFGTSSSHREG